MILIIGTVQCTCFLSCCFFFVRIGTQKFILICWVCRVQIFLEGYICRVQPGPKFDSRGRGRGRVQNFSSFATSSTYCCPLSLWNTFVMQCYVCMYNAHCTTCNVHTMHVDGNVFRLLYYRLAAILFSNFTLSFDVKTTRQLSRLSCSKSGLVPAVVL